MDERLLVILLAGLGIAAAAHLMARRAESELAALAVDSAEDIGPRQFSAKGRLLLIGLVFFSAFVGLALVLGPGLALPVAGLLTWGGVRLMAARQRLRHEDELKAAMPELCDLLASSMRSGLSLRNAFGQLALRLKGPMAVEVRSLVSLSRTGLAIEQGIDRWAERLGIPSARLFAFCVQMSVQSGGGLGEALLRLGESIRQQLALEAKISALTAQGRLQAIVMIAIPPLLMVVMSFIDPSSTDFFLDTRTGQFLLAGVIVLEAVGGWWIYKIIDIEV